MVLGYDPDTITKSTFIHHIASGTLGGAVTRALISPFDVVKIRFQLQSEAGKARRYRGLFQATRVIFKEEGVTAFWKGHIPAQWLSMVYGGVQFCAFEFFTTIVHQILPHSRQETVKNMTTHGVCGALSAIVATIVAQPLDVLRTRFAAQTEPKTFTSATRAAFFMVRQEGYFSLYRGLIPSLVQIVPFSAMQFGSRSFFEAVWISHGLKPGNFSEFICGGCAGLLAKTFVYPLDVVKKRLQIQGFAAPTVSQIRHYRSFSTVSVQYGDTKAF
uniref:mitochondrial thiamine pyrophosphate carrier-like n=1 Tax=Styela clava TaxID=7725 RepID=UPI00193A879B|nr:mitochondrial thiamine pyrophosphate carrier-like [Styela clava]